MSDGAAAPQEAAPEASPAPESDVSAETAAEPVETPEGGEESTAPTPVRESLPAKQAGKQGLDEVADRFRDKYGIGGREGGEGEPPATDEPPEDEPSAGESEPVSAEEAATTDELSGDTLPEGYYADEGGRIHRPNGEFASRQELAAGEEGGTEPQAKTTDGLPAGDADLKVPDGFERVELPAGHPLRDRGMSHTLLPDPEVVGQEHYEALRSGLNNPVRNRDVEAASQRASEAEQRAAEAEARMEIMSSPEFRRLDPEQNPELKAQIEDHRQAYGDEAAELLEESLEARREKLLDQATDEARTEAEWRETAARFVQTIGQHAERLFPVWAESGELRQYLPRLIGEYSQLVDAGQAAPNPREFTEWVWYRYYGRDPRVQRQQKQAQQGPQPREAPQEGAGEEGQKTREELKEEIRQEVIEELKADEAERLKDAATRRHRTTPGRLPSADAGVRTPVGREDEGIDPKGKTPDQVRKAGKKRLLEKFRR